MESFCSLATLDRDISMAIVAPMGLAANTKFHLRTIFFRLLVHSEVLLPLLEIVLKKAFSWSSDLF